MRGEPGDVTKTTKEQAEKTGMEKKRELEEWSREVKNTHPCSLLKGSSGGP